MSRFGIIVEVDRCVGCQACAVACKEENQVPPGVFFLKILRSENIEDNVVNYYRASCQHCDNPACMKICPAKAISKVRTVKFSSTRRSASAATCARRPAPTACRSSRRASRATTATRSSLRTSARSVDHAPGRKGRALHALLASSRKGSVARLRGSLRHPCDHARRLRQADRKDEALDREGRRDERSRRHAAEGPLHRQAHGLQDLQDEALIPVWE